MNTTPNTDLTTYVTEHGGERRVVATPTKKAAAEALGLTEWIARKHLEVSTFADEVAKATAQPGRVLGEAELTAVPPSMPAPPRDGQRPRGVSCVPSLAGVLENLPLAFAHLSAVTPRLLSHTAAALVTIGWDGGKPSGEVRDLLTRAVEADADSGRLPGGVVKSPGNVTFDDSPHRAEAVAAMAAVEERLVQLPEDARHEARLVLHGYLTIRFAAGNFIAPNDFVINRWLKRHELPVAAAA